MQNMWLTAETLGRMQIMSVFSSQQVETELRKILSIPDYIDIAFACRLGTTGYTGSVPACSP